MSEQHNQLEPISDLEEIAYRACLNIIHRGMCFYFEVGSALLEIYDGKLYRSRFKSFLSFLKSEVRIEGHAIHYSYARKLMASAEFTQNLIAAQQVDTLVESVTIGDTFPLPTAERQTRALQGLPPEQQVEVWKAAVEEVGGNVPSGRIVAETANAMKAQPQVSVFTEEEEDEPEEVRKPERSKRTFEGSWFKCVSGSLEQKGRWMWLKVFSPSTQKEFPFAFPVKELLLAGWQPPEEIPEEIEGEKLLDPDVSDYLQKQTAKANAVRKRMAEQIPIETPQITTLEGFFND